MNKHLHFAGYTPGDRLYAGGSTVLYRATRVADGAKVVIKTHRSDFPTPIERAKLRHEHALLQELKGRGILAVDPLLRSGHRVALVMEDVGARSLDHLLSAPLDLSAALRIIIGVLEVLRRAHPRGVVHRDIKPRNILVAEAPRRIYLIDWGIASRIAERGDGQSPGAIASALPKEATLAYLAPEQTGLLNRPCDERADLYALGVTFYELLLGVRPFLDEDPKALLHSHLTRPPRPPVEVDPRIPKVISDIVLKLLAKMPENRYASAHGLERDLVEALGQWERLGRVEPFTLGRSDEAKSFRIPHTMYGREADLEEVRSAFERARSGGAELLLITGQGGIGKSSLVREARGRMMREGAHVAEGKFEQFRGAMPYASVADALRGLLRQVLGESDRELENWRSLLLAALGGNASVLVPLLPELARILGPTEPSPELAPPEAEARFQLVIRQFVSVFAQPARPLVLLLDDLQWAEPASLRLLQSILTSPGSRHLLVTGAYRDHDADAIALLARALQDIAEFRGPAARIALRPLSPGDVDRFIADTLRTLPERVAPLGREIYRKTHGNPFFVGQLLTVLKNDGLLAFEEDAGAWRWDLAEVARLGVADNVVDLMVRRLSGLDPEARRLLALAACMGAQFEHGAIARLAALSLAACAHRLWPALVEGLLVPLDEDYKFLGELEDAPAPDEAAPHAQTSKVRYRFLHDRVHEASYSLLGEDERRRAHLAIADLLRAGRSDADLTDEEVFAIVDHLNAGALALEGTDARLEAAALNLRAGRRARESVAYAAARAYFEQGISRLPERAWEVAHAISFSLHLERAEAIGLCGGYRDPERLDEAEVLYRHILEHASTPELRRHAQVSYIRLLTRSAARAQYTLQIALPMLASLGAPLPETDAELQATFEEELARVTDQLRSRAVAEIIAARPLSDPQARTVLEILILIDAPSFIVNPKLSALVSLRQVSLSLAHGPSDLAACGYVTLGISMSRTHGKIPEVERALQVGIALCARYPSAQFSPKAQLNHAGAISGIAPLRDAIPYFESSIATSLRYCNTYYLALSVSSHQMLLLSVDEQLPALLAQIESSYSLTQWTAAVTQVHLISLTRQAVASLMGRTRAPCSFSDDGFDEDAFLDKTTLEYVLYYYWALKFIVLCIHGDEGAFALLEKVDRGHPYIPKFFLGQVSFYVCLLLCERLGDAQRATAGEASRLRSLLDRHHAVIAERKALSEETWGGYDLLIAAERARLDGMIDEAQRLYDASIDVAQREGFVRLHALGNEASGRFNLKRGHARIARLYLREARASFLRWGAQPKVDALAERYPEFVRAATYRPPPDSTTVTTSTTALKGVLIDLEEAMRAAHSISREIITERVIEQFLYASSKSARATRACVVLARGAELTVAARLSAGEEVVTLSPGAPLTGASGLSEALVRYVARSREAVVLGEDDPRGPLGDDPYLREHAPRSVICLPISQRGELLGVWYAESDVLGKLRRGTVELLQMLATQAASALANALLYDEIARANRHLQEEVSRRTAELRDANEQLRLDLDARARGERERAALQEQIIHLQEEAIQELSTPLIPLDESVIVMPLIGAVDNRRAGRMMEAVLTYVHARRARVVIIDVTGVRQSTEAAAPGLMDALVRLSSALRLLGARAVLTGLHPRMAQIVAELGTDTRGLTLRSSLQEGIAFAMKSEGPAERGPSQSGRDKRYRS